jgi:hypothetical protein
LPNPTPAKEPNKKSRDAVLKPPCQCRKTRRLGSQRGADFTGDLWRVAWMRPAIENQQSRAFLNRRDLQLKIWIWTDRENDRFLEHASGRYD